METGLLDKKIRKLLCLKVGMYKEKSPAQPLKQGLTFIEVIIVIAILLILFATVLFLINPRRRIAQSRDAARKAHIGQLASSVNAYVADYQVYPVSQQELEDIGALKAQNIRDPSTGAMYPFVSNASYRDEVSIYTELEAPDDPNRPYWTFRSACGDSDAYSYLPDVNPPTTTCDYSPNRTKTMPGRGM